MRQRKAVARRFSFLAEASTVLARSLDLETIQNGLLHLVVPALAEFAAVTLFGESPQSWRSELAWVRSADEAIQNKSLSTAQGFSKVLTAALLEVLATGKAQTPKRRTRGTNKSAVASAKTMANSNRGVEKSRPCGQGRPEGLWM